MTHLGGRAAAGLLSAQPHLLYPLARPRTFPIAPPAPLARRQPDHLARSHRPERCRCWRWSQRGHPSRARDSQHVVRSRSRGADAVLGGLIKYDWKAKRREPELFRTHGIGMSGGSGRGIHRGG